MLWNSNLLIEWFNKYLLNIYCVHIQLGTVVLKQNSSGLFPIFAKLSWPYTNCNTAITTKRLKQIHMSHLEVIQNGSTSDSYVWCNIVYYAFIFSDKVMVIF